MRGEGVDGHVGPVCTRGDLHESFTEAKTTHPLFLLDYQARSSVALIQQSTPRARQSIQRGL